VTPVAIRALEFVRDYIDTRGFPPSQVEIADHLGVSKPRVTQLVNGLIDQGRLTKNGNAHRSLAIVGAIDLRTVPTTALTAELGRRGMTLNALVAPEQRSMSRHAVTCAVDFCDVIVKRGHLMCRAHWFAVPDEMRSGILAAFGAGDGDTYQDLVWRAREIAAQATAKAA
jgi:hypothetical protein